MNIIRNLAYNKAFDFILRNLLYLFYKRNFLTGKYFEEKRIGFLWCIRSLPNIIGMHRQKVYCPVHPQCNIWGE